MVSFGISIAELCFGHTNYNKDHIGQRCLFQTNLKWADKKKPNFKGWLHLYGTEADAISIRIKYLQWGKDDDANMLSCGQGGA